MRTLDGLTDSLAGVVSEPEACPACGGTTWIRSGGCARCLLSEGLEENQDFEGDTLESLLEEVDIPEQKWHFGHYEVLGEIGRGGMGVIYRARQRHSRRVVALKRILNFEGETPETLQRFRREAEAAASLDHPHILPVYEVNETAEGIPYFSMKYATGGSLRTAGPALRKEPRECVRLLAKVARAVEYAHSRGILHRDLQPGNILLDGRSEPLVSDFGLARWLDDRSDLTRTLTTLGTPGFIAPESGDEKAGKLTPAADIYSLGAILFELLTGRSPFLGATALSVIRQAAETPAPKLRSLQPSLDRDLETIVARCLEREPTARYASAGALAEDLERWVAGRPIVARPVSLGVRVWRWACREPVLAGASAVCCLLAATVLFLLLEGQPSVAPSTLPGKSIAVLPFEDLSGQEENPLFAEGVLDDILTSLGRMSDLKVISRSSVGTYLPGRPRNLRVISRELGVRYIMEGSVRKTGERVRISVHLSDAQTGQQLWAENYERHLRDVFGIQAAIAEQIAQQLQARLSPQEQQRIRTRPTADMAAYELYLRARELAHQAFWLSPGQRTETQVRLLNEVIARAPDFVPALCLLSRVHVQSYFSNRDHSPARLEDAWRALERAARLQPEAGEVHLARGIVFYWGERNYAAARAELNLARAVLPNEADIPYFLGLIARREGDWLASTNFFDEARAIDPRNEVILFELARTNYFALKRYRDAAEAAESVLAWKPDAFDFILARAKVDVASHGDLRRWRTAVWGPAANAADPALIVSERVELALLQRDYRTARKELGAHQVPEFRWDGYVIPTEWYEGLIARGLGETEAARSAFVAARVLLEGIVKERPDDAQAHIVLAEILARLGEKEAALREGELAHSLRPPSVDAVDGAYIVGRLAAIHALAGDSDGAINLLQQCVSLPNAITYGSLRLEECWDSLRNESRFQKILASLAPEE
ncbi:MAG: protein kinase [Chthoniobacterales bacterium]